MSPVCAACAKVMRCAKTGVVFEEGTEDGRPYKLWSGDLYMCPQCAAQVIVGVPSRPIGEHYQPDYAALVAMYKPMLKTV